METVLRVKDLSVQLGGETVLSGLSFEIKKGEVLTILGPNGAGKTTLLRALLGILPYKGEVVWKEGIGVSYLPARLTQERFRQIPLSLKEFFKLETRSDEKISDMLGKVGLDPQLFLHRRPVNLSSGEFQRMLIAWSLMSDPDVLLFDEPTAGIDIGGKETIYTLLHSFWEEKRMAVLLVTHEMDIVYAHSTNVLCLHKKEFCYGKPEEVLTPQILKELYGQDIKFYKHHL